MLSKTNRLVHLLRAAIYLATLFLLFYANEFISFITYPTPVCFLGVLFFRHWMVCFILAAIVIFLIVSSRSFFESLNYSRKLVHTVLQTIAIIPMSASIIYIFFLLGALTLQVLNGFNVTPLILRLKLHV